MKKQEILLTTPMLSAKSSAIIAWLNRENSFFSAVQEESVSNRQVLFIGHTCLSFSALVGFFFVAVVPALVCLGWFVLSLFICVKGGLR